MKNKHNFQAKKSCLVKKRYIKICARKGLLKNKSSYRPEVTTGSLIVCALLLSFCTWLTLPMSQAWMEAAPFLTQGRDKRLLPCPVASSQGALLAGIWGMGPCEPPATNLPLILYKIMMEETPEAPSYCSSTPWKKIVLNSLPVRKSIPGRNLLNLLLCDVFSASVKTHVSKPMSVFTATLYSFFKPPSCEKVVTKHYFP